MQIFVEIERARLTRRLAIMRESEGKIAEAADIMQEVPVVSGGLAVFSIFWSRPSCIPGGLLCRVLQRLLVATKGTGQAGARPQLGCSYTTTLAQPSPA